MDLQLTNCVIIVVGGTGYIGSVIADHIRAEGATVVVGSRSGDGGIRLDASNQESVDAAIEQVLAEHGRLDGVVITAAPAAHTLDSSRLSDPEQVATALDGKSLSFLRVANAVLPVLTAAGYGRIVGISGQIAYITGNITGTIRNAALNIAAKSLADEVAGSGVTINTVNPGNVRDEPSSTVEYGKPGQSSPAQIADLVTFLISPLSAAVSGENLSVGHKMRGINFQ